MKRAKTGESRFYPLSKAHLHILSVNAMLLYTWRTMNMFKFHILAWLCVLVLGLDADVLISRLPWLGENLAGEVSTDAVTSQCRKAMKHSYSP